MKTLNRLAIIAALLTAPLATASTYKGTWNNETFGSSGDLTIDFTVKKNRVLGSFDLDGPVFGFGDPPPIPIDVKLDSNGAGTFEALGTNVGDVVGNVTANGKLTITITNIPGGFLTMASLDGKFNLKLETFAATYSIDAVGGPYANGTAEAHVHKSPKIKVPSKVVVEGKSAKVKVKVITNTEIKTFKATANKGAKARVVSKTPYRIAVSNLTAKKTFVKIVVVNDDGLRSAKLVKFVRK